VDEGGGGSEPNPMSDERIKNTVYQGWCPSRFCVSNTCVRAGAEKLKRRSFQQGARSKRIEDTGRKRVFRPKKGPEISAEGGNVNPVTVVWLPNAPR